MFPSFISTLSILQLAFSVFLLYFTSRNPITVIIWTNLSFPSIFHVPSFSLSLSSSCLSAPLWRDSSDRGSGAGRADQRASASWRRSIHSSCHGPTGWTSGCTAEEPHSWGEGQRRPQPYEGTVGWNHVVNACWVERWLELSLFKKLMTENVEERGWNKEQLREITSQSLFPSDFFLKFYRATVS